MSTNIDYRTIEAGMIEGRTQRSQAFLEFGRQVAHALRNTARTLVAIFS